MLNCPHCNIPVDEHDATGCMDAWVHESIFGWTADYVWPDPSKNTVGQWTHPVEEDYFGSPSPYSTDIADAWQVVEKWDAWTIYKRWNGELWYLVCLTNGEEWYEGAESDTVPLAICRAAIKSEG